MRKALSVKIFFESFDVGAPTASQQPSIAARQHDARCGARSDAATREDDERIGEP
jgi:hypothetical protein